MLNRIIYKYYQLRFLDLFDKNPYQINFRNRPYKIIFILSHMRSGSSLLSHILCSNPEIIGYGETHLTYESPLDFKKLMFNVYWQVKDLNMNHTYVLDKILHNHKILEDELIYSPNIYKIFLLREPTRTLPSILGIKPHWSEEKALDYYVERLDKLADYAKNNHNPERSFYINYDALLENNQGIFDRLQNFLGTPIPFSEKYQVLHTTGIKGIGDSSENIKVGRIIKTEPKLQHEFCAQSLAKAIEAYEHCDRTLSQNTTTRLN
jgi:hypothetical protein